MSCCEEIKTLTRRVELLAPAGRWEALEAVLDAGADAVYLSARRFSMRRHRGDFHFTEAQLADAVSTAHDLGRRLYVTVNSLLAESELPGARELLQHLNEIGVDAVIVQDLATLHLAKDLNLRVPLHASTMMNVHHPQQAEALKSLGISRIIPSRDISIAMISEIGRLAKIEVECFVHGDMCVAQSGQCSMSGVLFGKSANRGECMKPCRWEYDLVRLDDGETVGAAGRGHLLAIKDLCLIRHIPDLIHAGICSFKIEGRMRDARYLGSLVARYRRAINAYYDCPLTFRLSADTIEHTYRTKVRELSTLTLLGGQSHRDHFDVSGRREPLFLSNGCVERPIEEQPPPGNGLDLDHVETPADHRVPELAVCVADGESAEAAVSAGADRIYLAAEVSQFNGSCWSLDTALDIIRAAHRRGAAVGLRTPRVTTQREWAETQWILKSLTASQRTQCGTGLPVRCTQTGILPVIRRASTSSDTFRSEGRNGRARSDDTNEPRLKARTVHGPPDHRTPAHDHATDEGLDSVCVHHLGTLRLAKAVCPNTPVIADYGFNLLNSAAAEVLLQQGVTQATVSNEAGYNDLAAIARRSPLPLEILAHGPVTGMLIDHCVIALHATPLGRKDVCRGPCRHVPFALRDRLGEVRPVIADQHCRNHLLTAHDLAIFPYLEKFLFPTVRSIRIEGQFYSPQVIAALTRAYRLRLDAPGKDSGRADWEEAWEQVIERSPRPLNLGPYARSIVDSRSTAMVMREAVFHG